MGEIPAWLIEAEKHLRKTDPIITAVIDRAGPCSLRPREHHFATLAGSIISQQISVKAADAIEGRLLKALGSGGLTAEGIAALGDEAIRAAGISPQKLKYLRDLSGKVLDGTVHLAQISQLPDEEIIRELIKVKGIGLWTVQMFLIFSLNRTDVFPYDDLGVRNGIRNLYGYKSMPARRTAERIAAKWAPYRSVGSWYCWRSLEFAKAAIA